jgi:hypothetical protein
MAEPRGVESAEDVTLLGKVEQLSTTIDDVRDELNQLRGVREYIWTDENGEPLEKMWYTDYMFPSVRETMGLFYWNIESDTISLSFHTDANQNFIVDPDNISELYDKLFELGTTYCTQIGRDKNLNSVLSAHGFTVDEHYLANLRDQLVNQSQTPLSFDETLAQDYQYHVILASNGLDGVSQLQQKVRETSMVLDDEQLISMIATDPFTLYVKQRRAIVPLNAINSLNVSREAYSLEYGLLEPQLNANSKLTAVYQAEAYALKYEQRFSNELQSRPDLTHPYVMLGFTEPRRARMFMLSIAAGEIELTGPRVGTNNEYDVLVYDNDDEYSIDVNGPTDNLALHPLVRAYHSFVFDKNAISDALIVEREKRFVEDAVLPEIWTDWLKTGYRELLNEVQGDSFNEPIIRDIVSFARLFTIDFRRRYHKDS